MISHLSKTPSAKASARKYLTEHTCLDDFSSYNSMTGLSALVIAVLKGYGSLLRTHAYCCLGDLSDFLASHEEDIRCKLDSPDVRG
jgi:hypothetical protein